MTRTRWWWVVAVAIVVVAGVATGTVLLRHDGASSTRPSLSVRAPRHVVPAKPNAAPAAPVRDCEAIDELAREIMAPPQQDETEVQRSERLADKARATADAVSEPTRKQEVNRWADGFALLAASQRLAGDSAATDDSASMAARSRDVIEQTADALRQECPDGWPVAP